LTAILWILLVLGALWTAIPLIDRRYDLKKRGFEVAPGLLLWRTKRGLGLLDRIASSPKRLWEVFGIAGAAAGGILTVTVFLNLTDKAIGIIGAIISPPPAGGGVPGVVPIVPGWTVPLGMIPPFLIAIATVLLVHESAHGIVARRVGIPVKSAGLLVLAVIPGAFVEPDEEKMKKSPVSERLQVYGAGPFANILFGFLCLGILLALITPLPGLYVAGVFDNTPAGENLRPGMRLMEVGYAGEPGIEIRDYRDLDDFMKDTRPGDNIFVVTDSGNFRFTLRSYPAPGESLTLITEGGNVSVAFGIGGENNGFLGVSTPYYPVPKSKIAVDVFAGLIAFWKSPGLAGGGINRYSYDYRAPGFAIDLLKWMFVLNLGIGLFNLLPLKPLDGGHIAECLAEKASSRSAAKKVATVLSAISLSVLVVNLLAWVA